MCKMDSIRLVPLSCFITSIHTHARTQTHIYLSCDTNRELPHIWFIFKFPQLLLTVVYDWRSHCRYSMLIKVSVWWIWHCYSSIRRAWKIVKLQTAGNNLTKLRMAVRRHPGNYYFNWQKLQPLCALHHFTHYFPLHPEYAQYYILYSTIYVIVQCENTLTLFFIPLVFEYDID